MPASVVQELEAIVTADPVAAERVAPYQKGVSYALWYPFRAGIMSLTYAGELAMEPGSVVAAAGTDYLTVFIDIRTRHVVDYQTDYQPI